MRRSRWWAWMAMAAVLVVGVAVVLATRGGGSPEPGASPTDSHSPSGSTSSTTSTTPTTPSPAPSPVPTPAPTASTVPKGADGSSLVAPFVSADAAARQDPAQPLKLDQVATGSALDDLQIQVAELTKGGLNQVGSPTVVSASVTASQPDANPPTATVLACLDYSSVDVVNSAGQSAKDTTAPQRVATILELVKQDGAWLVARRTFPDNPTC